jgi:CRP/FNR family cyclic AMP-dependent transcriptional regulator
MERPTRTRSPLLARIAEGDLTALLAGARSRSFRVRQPLFQRGDAPDGLYVVVSGRVRVVIAAPDGDDVTLATFGPGEVIGELSALDGTPRSATAVAATPAEALFIATAQFRSWVADHPSVAWSLLVELARRIRVTSEQVAEIALLDAETRIARHLWQWFADASDGLPSPGTRLHVSQRQIASALGVSRESVNKHLARLKASGTISIEGASLVLLKPETLRTFADAL